jgi:hypothetical protein
VADELAYGTKGGTGSSRRCQDNPHIHAIMMAASNHKDSQTLNPNLPSKVDQDKTTAGRKIFENDIAFCGSWLDYRNPGLIPDPQNTAHIRGRCMHKTIMPFSHVVDQAPQGEPGYLEPLEDPLLVELANL